ncbi:MAG: NUDIX domain-containing protein [Acidimicrobiia bacterium]|nr:MAG: NUDIX domain-containing protein [Acidimicrobiia bacterium]
MGTAYRWPYIRLVEPAAIPDVVPSPAATVIALRRVSGGFEVLLVRRAREARFMGGARVFPGGGVDEVDRGPAASAAVRWSGDPDELPWRAAALRELAEEAGLLLTDRPVSVDGLSGAGLYDAIVAAGARFDADTLVYLSNWVTPRGLPRRFDARFYVVEVPAGTVAVSDRVEVYDAAWVTPAAAIAAAEEGAWYVEHPTRVHLEMLAAESGIDEVLAMARSRPAERIEPRIYLDEAGEWSIAMPGDPGYGEVTP